MKDLKQLFSTIVLNRKVTHFPLCLLTLAGLITPNYLHADCVPTAPSGYSVPFIMTELKNYPSGKAFASYTTGQLFAKDYLLGTTVWSATKLPQLFSDRYGNVDCRSFCLNQPFDINQADQLGVSISDGYNFLTGQKNILVTMTLESWGNGQASFSGTCDSTTGVLYGTIGGNTFVTIAFGTPQPPPPVIP